MKTSPVVRLRHWTSAIASASPIARQSPRHPGRHADVAEVFLRDDRAALDLLHGLIVDEAHLDRIAPDLKCR